MPKRAPSKTSPLIRSSAILRGFATAITLSSLGGMTAFAATHVQNAAAPLAPSAPASRATSLATPAPTSQTTTTRRSTTLTSSVATTTTAARTKTKQS